MPTETNRVDAVAQATVPVTFDFGYGDPDLPAISSGNTAAATFATSEADAGVVASGHAPAWAVRRYRRPARARSAPR